MKESHNGHVMAISKRSKKFQSCEVEYAPQNEKKNVLFNMDIFNLDCATVLK